MKRSLILLLSFIITASLFSACGNSENKNSSIDVSAFAEELLDCGAFSETLEPVDSDAGLRLYGLDPSADDAPAESLFYMSAGATAHERTVFTAADEAGVKVIADKAAERLNYLKRSFADYNPGEVAKLDECIIKTSGVYVLFLVADDYTAAQAVVERYF